MTLWPNMENMTFYDFITFVIDFVGVRFFFQISFHSFLRHRKNTNFVTLNGPRHNMILWLISTSSFMNRSIMNMVCYVYELLCYQRVCYEQVSFEREQFWLFQCDTDSSQSVFFSLRHFGHLSEIAWKAHFLFSDIVLWREKGNMTDLT